MELRSGLLRATLLGFVILGIGSRLLMRVVALIYLVTVDVVGRLASRVGPRQDMSLTLTG